MKSLKVIALFKILKKQKTNRNNNQSTAGIGEKNPITARSI